MGKRYYNWINSQNKENTVLFKYTHKFYDRPYMDTFAFMVIGSHESLNKKAYKIAPRRHKKKSDYGNS